MRPLAAHCQFGMGELHAATGQRGQAQAALALACRFYEEMGMSHWTMRARAAQSSVA